MNKEELTVGVVVNDDSDCGDEVVGDLRKARKENSRIKALDFQRVDCPLQELCLWDLTGEGSEGKGSQEGRLLSRVIFKHHNVHLGMQENEQVQ